MKVILFKLWYNIRIIDCFESKWLENSVFAHACMYGKTIRNSQAYTSDWYVNAVDDCLFELEMINFCQYISNRIESDRIYMNRFPAEGLIEMNQLWFISISASRDMSVPCHMKNMCAWGVRECKCVYLWEWMMVNRSSGHFTLLDKLRPHSSISWHRSFECVSHQFVQRVTVHRLAASNARSF